MSLFLMTTALYLTITTLVIMNAALYVFFIFMKLFLIIVILIKIDSLHKMCLYFNWKYI